MKILNSKTKNFDKNLDYLLFKRRKSIKSDKVSVTNIINDVKKNGDTALIKYEKKFNRNSTIIPSAKKITKLINSLNPMIKKAIDTAYNRIYNFILCKNLRIFRIQINLKTNLNINIYH